MEGYNLAGRIKNGNFDNYWVVSAEEDSSIYYVVVKYMAGEKYKVKYSFVPQKNQDRYDLDSGGDIPRDFKYAYEIDEGDYPNCCSLIAGNLGTDDVDMYKISVGKNKKLVVRLIPESDALLGVEVYNGDKESQVSKEGANKGAIVNTEFVSLKKQTVYFSATRDFYSSFGGDYGFEVSIEDASSGEISAAKSAQSISSSSSDSGYEFLFGGGDSSDSFFSGSFLIIILIASLAFYVYLALALMSMAKKTGTANGWFAWAPILNLVLMANIAQMSAWALFLLLVPIANIVLVGMLWWKIAERRGFSGRLGLLMFVPAVNLVMLGVFAWKDSGAGGEISSSKPKPSIVTQSTKTVSKSITPSHSSNSERGFSFKNMKKSYMLIGALAILAISVLLPWASIGAGFISISISGWDVSWITKVLLFLALGVGGLVYYKKDQGVKAAIGLAAVSLAYIIYGLISPPKIGSGFASVAVSFGSFGFGYYLFIIASIAVGVLGWIVMKSGDSGVAPVIKVR